MNDLERFLAVVNFERPDYWPILAAHALGFPHEGAMPKLHREGMPDWVRTIDDWCRYWGTFTWQVLPGCGEDAPGIRTEKWTEGEFEFVRSETGALTRQVLDNDMTYSMPDFVEFSVRDRASWEKFRDLSTPRAKRDAEEIAALCAGRTRPAAVFGGSTWGNTRNWMGPERALLAFYDCPDLLRDMIAWQDWMFEQFTVPVLERVRPEVLLWWEDFCYNHGMLISPDQFRRFCAPRYRKAATIARDCGVKMMIVDSDGKVDEFIPLLEEVGFNALFPLEQASRNDVLELRRRHPRFILAGGIEKEISSSDNGHRIRGELLPKVPAMLAGRGCLPTFDHGQSTLAGFEEHCMFYTLMHKLCGSPSNLGMFPRMACP